MVFRFGLASLKSCEKIYHINYLFIQCPVPANCQLILLFYNKKNLLASLANLNFIIVIISYRDFEVEVEENPLLEIVNFFSSKCSNFASIFRKK